MSETQTTLGDASTAELKQIDIGKLELTELRDVRKPVVDEIKERITSSGFNPARPLRVVPQSDGYAVADGNHRLKALQELGVRDTVPSVVEPNRDLLAVAVESNQDEDTYAEPDLFDKLDYISREKDRGLTLSEIAAKVDGWSESMVMQHSSLLSNTLTQVRELARQHQEGRVSNGLTSVSFTEGWFRTSGLYELADKRPYGKPSELLPAHPQERVMYWYIHEENADASKNQLKKKVERVAEKCEQLELIDSELQEGVDPETKLELQNAVVEGEYTHDTLETAVENANADAEDTALFGVDCLEKLQELPDDSIDCVVTDPPWGTDFKTHRDGIAEDYGIDKEGFEALMSAMLVELERVCTANAHIYIFFAMNNIGVTRRLLSEHFELTETPLLWLKDSHAPTQDSTEGFEKRYAHKYESIFVARMPNGRERRICEEGVETNVFNYAKPSGDDRWYDSQKPQGLLRDLITNSTGPGETVLDPFAGSGSTLLAAKATGRHYKGFELSEKPESDFRRRIRELHNGGGEGE
jgi:DNA modification methylase/DNA-binding transcriptional MerR regulator